VQKPVSTNFVTTSDAVSVATSPGRRAVNDGDPYPWVGRFSELASDDARAVAELVAAGGAIIGTAEEIAGRLKRARCIAILREDSTGRIVGIAALKRPQQAYRLNKFADAGVPIKGYEEALELGYVVVAEDMRGRRLSRRLVELVADEIGEPVFATTGSGTMKNNLERSGFAQVGREWRGNSGALSLWIYSPS